MRVDGRWDLNSCRPTTLCARPRRVLASSDAAAMGHMSGLAEPEPWAEFLGTADTAHPTHYLLLRREEAQMYSWHHWASLPAFRPQSHLSRALGKHLGKAMLP